ncbi:MAG: sigma-70 family RNA polymerase sigma factor [Planctomycetales bacterium]|nr:sigma-70 family RNA polymerase sigma factor [Planctomycetales bacterium]
MTDSDGRNGTSLSDRSLLRRFQAGEHDAATQLYLRYASRLLALADSHTSKALAARFDAEDVVQSVFRTFFRRASAGLYEVPPGDELWQLFLVIALNKVRSLSTYHHAQKRSAAKTTLTEDIACHSLAADQQPALILKMVIEETIRQLPETEQHMIHLRIEGFDVQQIADQTKRSKRTVERVLQRFRHELALQIDDVSSEDQGV